MEWKKLLSSIAPTIATALGGPLAGVALKSISETLFSGKDIDESDLKKLLNSGLDESVLSKLKEIDNAFTIKMRELDIDVENLKITRETLYVNDTQDARKYKDNKVFWLGVVILSSFALIMIVALFGSYALLTGSMPLSDPSTIGMVSGFVGTIIGYVAANAQQVVSFFFGSSAGSSKKSDAINDAFIQMTESRK